MGMWALAHQGLGEIDRLLVPPGKVSKLLTDHLITGKPLKSDPAQEKRQSPDITIAVEASIQTNNKQTNKRSVMECGKAS